jgi:alkylation response protein AidB-like acyl-CoA dehydrogenase
MMVRHHSDVLLDILPAIAALADRSEQERRVPPESIEMLKKVGAFKILQPKRFGGAEADLQMFYDITAAIGSACASTGWVSGVCGSHQWVVSQFSERAQCDVWEDAPETLVSGTYAPTGTAMPVNGGYRLSGAWGFASGCDHAGWHFAGAAIEPAANGARETAFFLVPANEVTFKDTWFSSGLRGTGSKDAEIDGAFVPDHRVLRLGDILAMDTPGLSANSSSLYRVPFFSVVPLGIVAPIVGATRRAIEIFIASSRDRVPRGGAMGNANKVADSPILQSKVAEALGMLDAVELLLQRDISETAAGAAGGTVTVDMRLRNRRDYALAIRICLQTIESIYNSSGAAGMFVPNTVERIWRDVHAAAKHVGLNWDGISAMVGRHAFGQEPRGQY